MMHDSCLFSITAIHFMENNRQLSAAQEDNDLNKIEPHDPVEDGRKAIEASKIANNSGASSAEQQEAEKKDADRWRNEG